MRTDAIAILCVVGLAIGQILFKASAISLSQTGSFFSTRTLSTLISAMFLYGITSIVWVWLLQKTELGRVYPFMALAFVLVPMGSHFFFGEQFDLRYVFGVVLIVAGIIVATGA